jgi:hypothetical protein
MLENSCRTPSIWISGHSSALQRGQKNAAQGVTQCQAKAAFQRFSNDFTGCSGILV